MLTLVARSGRDEKRLSPSAFQDLQTDVAGSCSPLAGTEAIGNEPERNVCGRIGGARRRRVRKLTIEVSEDDLQALAEHGYEGAANSDQDCRSRLSPFSLVTQLPVSTEPAETVLQRRLRRDTGVSGPTVTPLHRVAAQPQEP